ncbi:MAG: heparan N-sulfatase [Phycisphaeraceae bacterium]|nr:heparan N-sulfatase [Phycisphaeraceae bacterium]
MDRRRFLKWTAGTGIAAAATAGGLLSWRGLSKRDPRPNVVIFNADDWSWEHSSFLGCPDVKTPNFDRICREGVCFTNAYVSSPSCSPSRAALLTGRNFWELGTAADLRGNFPRDLQVYPDILKEAGYRIGLMKKGWGPGDFKATGWEENPAGPPISFKRMMYYRYASLNPTQPFCYWFGSFNPHRPYDENRYVNADTLKVPDFLPDIPEVRKDVGRYLAEVQDFDSEVGYVLNILEEFGELDHTIIIVTGDNGMPFPRAKTNLYDHGTRVPLAIRWPEGVNGGRVVTDFVNHTDLAPTILAAARIKQPDAMTGHSLANVLQSEKQGRIDPYRDFVVTGRESHETLYPMRAIRTDEYLYIRNFEPDRWPSLAESVDDDGVSFDAIMACKANPNTMHFYEQALGRRPVEELYAIKDDPYQLKNLADDPKLSVTRELLQKKMVKYLTNTKDPRVVGNVT